MVENYPVYAFNKEELVKAFGDMFADFINALREDAYMFNWTALVEMLEDAISELAVNQCSNCNTYIGTDLYLGREDIEAWLKARLHPTDVDGDGEDAEDEITSL